MSDDNFRMERIKKLFSELECELFRGFSEGDIGETISWNHVFPVSRQIPGGVILLEFRARPLRQGLEFRSEAETCEG